MARRPSQLEQWKAIATVLAMWYQLMQHYVMLVTQLGITRYLLDRSYRAPPTYISMPLPREVYRDGFLHYATRTTDKHAINMLHMTKAIFSKLCWLLASHGGLKRTKLLPIDEMVAIFLVTVGHNIKNRKAQFLFQHSGQTISRTIKQVLLSILNVSHLLLVKPNPVPDDCTDRRWKHFKGCLGALDGMFVTVRAPKKTQHLYRNCKGQTSINVLGVCNQNMQFVYCLAGWSGSAHDSRILRHVMAHADSFSVPSGCYYLCDAGYTNARGFLTPYRGQRYHLQEWGRNMPATKEEYYNMKHSSARNVIERAFGILKLRWALLRDTSWFSQDMVSMIVNTCCLLHNFIRHEGGPDIFEQAYVPSTYSNDPVEPIPDPTPISYVEALDEWTIFRTELAQSMWGSRTSV